MLRICTLGVGTLDRYGMVTRGAAGLSGRPPGSAKPRISKMSNVALFNALRGSLLGVSLAVQDAELSDPAVMRDLLLAVVRAQRLGAKLAERLEKREGREVVVHEDDRDVSRIYVPAELIG